MHSRLKKPALLFAELLVLCLLAPSWVRADSAGRFTPFDWVFVYYMCCDNDLSPNGEGIIQELAKGLMNSDMAILVQADFHGAEKMRRIAISFKGGKLRQEEQAIAGANSDDEIAFADFLDWVRGNWKAKNYAVVLLNHGGTLNQMCLDETEGARLNSMKVGEITASFNKILEHKIRLVFLQQSGRGSLENVYNFVNAADYYLVSPVKTGAPGTYYSRMLSTVASRPEVSGLDLASAIMESDQHYALYTLVSNSMLTKLPEQLDPVIAALLNHSDITLSNNALPAFSFEDETNYDVRSFFAGIKPKGDAEVSGKVDDFLNWYQGSLIARKSRGPLRTDKDPNYSGLSIFVPSGPDQAHRYSFLPLYQMTKLEGLMRVLRQPRAQNGGK